MKRYQLLVINHPRKKYEKVSWLLIMLVLFFQSILQQYSFLSNIALLYIVILQYKKASKCDKNTLSNVLAWIIALLGYSILNGNEASLAIRFAFIVFIICFSYFWKVDSSYFLKILVWVSFILIIGMICLEAYMFTLSREEADFLRDNFFLANNLGDVFFYNFYYKLELRGTPLIAFVYMLSFSTPLFGDKYKWLFRVIYLIGVILAGNFAYQLIIIIFHLFSPFFSNRFQKPDFYKKILIRVILVIGLGGLSFSWVTGTLNDKSDHSIAPRIDQTKVLMSDMTNSGYTLLFGTGVGHVLNVKTPERDYRGNTYFELQSLYILNQLGLVNFTLLLLVNIMLAFRKICEKELLFVFLLYFIYASTNPYIWDTNQVIVIVSLLSARTQLCRKTEVQQLNRGNII